MATLSFVVVLLVVLAGQIPGGGCVELSRQRSLQQPSGEWVVVVNRGVKLNDINCVSKNQGVAKEGGDRSRSCKVCGGVPAVAAACQQNPKCLAFVMDDGLPASYACGYLKSAVTNQEESKSQALFCNSARGAKCAGAAFSFAPRTGMMFTGDYRCGSKAESSLCFHAGGINVVAAACLKDTECRAFAYNRADQGGYFKSAAGVASPTTGSDLYQRL